MAIRYPLIISFKIMGVELCMKINTFQQLLNKSLKVDADSVIYDYEKMEKVPVDPEIFNNLDNKVFSMKRGIVAFSLDGSIYMSPYFQNLPKLLNYAGYKQGQITHPFTETGRPADPESAEKWRNLILEARSL